ncbi:hypothetical protein [Phyllobacterium sp. P30BS-XVII]|uniref:hypothetical protein n=1 Tax=Phyllobacterium sp. P30BS-XVII TaxID=2587046 RepID=UPI0015FB9F10|nr:hypothetical protein [Phyllobacterium sp. P30BS-XVII]MBA8901238.1 putative subunit of tRNA(5-methylaminomethyl-2-thiouridylate) methyltransferase [Phyllobacterium sp. P30BS-XVII]
MSNESSKVIDACNLLTEVKYLVEVLFMAATDINNERQQSAIQYICDIADERIASVKTLLDGAGREQAGGAV